LIVPPPAELTALIAATKALWPPQDTLMYGLAEAEPTSRSATTMTLVAAPARKNTDLFNSSPSSSRSRAAPSEQDDRFPRPRLFPSGEPL
jgi:hypothetical protein